MVTPALLSYRAPVRDQLLSAHVQLPRGALRHWRAVACPAQPPLPPDGRRWTRVARCERLPRLCVLCVVVTAHWDGRQHGRGAGSAGRAHGTGRRDGRRAKHALQSCDFRSPSDRALRISLQETHLRNHQDITPGSQVSTSFMSLPKSDLIFKRVIDWIL